MVGGGAPNVKRPPTLGFKPNRKRSNDRHRRQALPWRSWYSLRRGRIAATIS
jgi:hypothetical protein